MENTPLVCADELPSILGMVNKYPKSRSVNNFLQRLDFDPNSMKDVSLPAKAPPSQMICPKNVIKLCSSGV